MNNKETKSNGNATALSWAAVVISSIALFMSYLAYNRSDKNLVPVVEKQVKQTVDKAEDVGQEIENEWNQAVIDARIAALRTQIQARENLEEVANEILAIREDVQAAYGTVNEVTDEQLRQLDRNLELLEQQVRSGSTEAIGTLEKTLSDLRQDIGTDER